VGDDRGARNWSISRATFLFLLSRGAPASIALMDVIFLFGWSESKNRSQRYLKGGCGSLAAENLFSRMPATEESPILALPDLISSCQEEFVSNSGCLRRITGAGEISSFRIQWGSTFADEVQYV
jgi:hypothetical protein